MRSLITQSVRKPKNSKHFVQNNAFMLGISKLHTMLSLQ